MAVTYDNSITAKNATNNAALSATLSVGALTNACAIAVISWGNTAGTARTVSTVKLDTATSFTRLGGTTLSLGAGRPEMGIDIWYLVGSISNANHTFDVTMSGNTRWKSELAITFQGVDQTTPMAGFVSDNTDVLSPSSLSPTGGTSSEFQVGGLLDFDGNGTATMGVSTNTTQRSTSQTDTGIFGMEFIAGTAPGDAASMGFTWTIIAPGTVTCAGVVKAVAAGGAGAGPLLNGGSLLSGGALVGGGRMMRNRVSNDVAYRRAA